MPESDSSTSRTKLYWRKLLKKTFLCLSLSHQFSKKKCKFHFCLSSFYNSFSMLFFLLELFFSLDSWFPIYEYFCSGSHIFICFRHNFIFVVGDRIFCFFTKFTSAAAAAECMPSELHQAISRSAKADSISPWQKLFPEKQLFSPWFSKSLNRLWKKNLLDQHWKVHNVMNL